MVIVLLNEPGTTSSILPRGPSFGDRRDRCSERETCILGFFCEYQKYPYVNLRWFNSVIKNYTKNYRPNTNVKNYLISHNSAVKVFKTRMHSSRMHTGRSLTVCRSLLPGGGGGGLLGRGVSLAGGLLGRGVSLAGGCLLGRRSGIPTCTEADPPMDRITDTSKNITLATTSLQPVIKVCW